MLVHEAFTGIVTWEDKHENKILKLRYLTLWRLTNQEDGRYVILFYLYYLILSITFLLCKAKAATAKAMGFAISSEWLNAPTHRKDSRDCLKRYRPGKF